MDLQLIIALNVMTISAMVIGASIIYGAKDAQPWLAVNAVVVVVGALALWFTPDTAGTWTAIFFLPLVVAPIVLARLSSRSLQTGRMRAGATYAWWSSLFHPTAANRLQAKLTASLTGSDEANAQTLKALIPETPLEFRPIIAVNLALTRRDWREMLAISSVEPDAGPAVRVAMKPFEIRALAETGRTDSMVHCYASTKDQLAGANFASLRMLVLAFGGRPNAVASLLEKQLSTMDDETKAYWVAVAHLYSGVNSAAGDRALAKLAATATNQKTRAAAQRQLDTFASPKRQPLSSSASAQLDAMEHQVFYDAAVKTQSFRAYPVTVALIGLCLLAFAAEIYMGGSEDTNTLLKLGALAPANVFEKGQWWRLITATFLHFGPIHLASNMFVLWIFGRMLEPMLGSLRLLSIYLFGAVASSAFVLWLMSANDTDYGFLVGASGAIFALLGTEAAIVLLDWLRDRANFDTRKLSMLAMMLGLQIAIDLSLPNVSLAAHLSGFAAGLVAMLASTQIYRLSRSQTKRTGPLS